MGIIVVLQIPLPSADLKYFFSIYEKPFPDPWLAFTIISKYFSIRILLFVSSSLREIRKYFSYLFSTPLNFWMCKNNFKFVGYLVSISCFYNKRIRIFSYSLYLPPLPSQIYIGNSIHLGAPQAQVEIR